MTSGSLQSSALLLLPRITHESLTSTRQVTCTGRQGGVTPSAGLVALLGDPEAWPPSQSSQPWQLQQPRFEPRLENPLQNPDICRLRVPWDGEGHYRTC